MIYLNNDSFLCDKPISLPRGVFFLSLSLSSSPGWRMFLKGGSADGMASDQTGDGVGGFSKHTWAILKFGCVSWRGDNKERGWSRATFPLERKTQWFWDHLSFLFGRGYCRGLSLAAFWFSSFPLILSYKSTMWLHTVSLSMHIKTLAIKPAIT